MTLNFKTMTQKINLPVAAPLRMVLIMSQASSYVDPLKVKSRLKSVVLPRFINLTLKVSTLGG